MPVRNVPHAADKPDMPPPITAIFSDNVIPSIYEKMISTVVVYVKFLDYNRY